MERPLFPRVSSQILPLPRLHVHHTLVYALHWPFPLPRLRRSLIWDAEKHQLKGTVKLTNFRFSQTKLKISPKSANLLPVVVEGSLGLPNLPNQPFFRIWYGSQSKHKFEYSKSSIFGIGTNQTHPWIPGRQELWKAQ